MGTVLGRGHQYLGSNGLSPQRDLLGDRRRIDRDRRSECGDGNRNAVSPVVDVKSDSSRSPEGRLRWRSRRGESLNPDSQVGRTQLECVADYPISILNENASDTKGGLSVHGRVAFRERENPAQSRISGFRGHR